MANDYERRMIRVLDHIHDQPAGDLSLDALAEVAALSRFHFHRVFHAMTGETVANTVRRMRLHRAATALIQDQTPIAAIARRVGYPNLASFSRAFCDAYRLTPAAFRKRGQLRPDFPCSLTKGPLMYPVEIRNHAARHPYSRPPDDRPSACNTGGGPDLQGPLWRPARGLHPAARRLAARFGRGHRRPANV